MKELANQFLGASISSTHPSPFAPVSSIRRRIQSFETGIQLRREAQNRDHVQSKLPPIPVPSFDGTDLEAFLKDFFSLFS